MALICLIAVACSQAEDTPIASSVPSETLFSAEGLITKIDEAEGTVTIDHKEIPGLMAAMEMEFSAESPIVVSKELVGRYVHFKLRKNAEGYELIEVVKSKQMDPKEKYLINCARCHGELGEGRLKGIPFIKGHALAHSEEDFIGTVTNGKKKMPSFRDEFSDEEIKWIVRYVRKVLQQGRTSAEKHIH